MHLGDILDILAERAGSMSLEDSMYLARQLQSLHSAVLYSKEQDSYNTGHKDGYELGKRDATHSVENWNAQTAQRCYEASLKRAETIVGDIVGRVGRDKKIQCIKSLREQTSLGLKDSKDIVDRYIARLDEMEDQEPPF